MTDITRREFVKVGAAGAAALAVGVGRAEAAAQMPERPLGKTGYQVRIFSLGGQATLETAGMHDEAIAIINRAIDLGVNYLDTAAAYGRDRSVQNKWEANGISQTYVGEVMKARRKEVFLASKTDDRSRDGSLKLLEQSLKLLNTDHLDLWQLHNVQNDDQIEQIFGKGGAIEALQQARDQKMVRFLGITGHYDPAVLIKGIQRFDFDTVLMALNAGDPHRFSFQQELLPLAAKKKMGIIGMKIPARGRILSSWTPPPLERQRNSWEGVVIAEGPGTIGMREAMYYTLSLPVSTVIIGCDSVAQLEENVRLARAFTPLTGARMAALAEQAAPCARQALFFRFFDRA
jgi:aryl-alcohol dehydrogenase-like predicted oxidoreductase